MTPSHSLARGRFFLLAGAGAVGATVPALTLLVRYAGWQIPNVPVDRDYAIGLWWAFILAAVIFVLPLPRRDKPAILILWAIKCCVTLGFMLAYESHYTLDAYGYFATHSLPSPPWADLASRRFSGNSFVGIFSWYHGHLLPPSYHALKVSCSLIGLSAIYIFYRAGVIFMRREDLRVLYLLALYPSILFWSSILGKDPFMLFAVALYTFGVVAWSIRGGGGNLVIAGAGIAVATLIRLWMAPIMIAPMVVIGFRVATGAVQRLMIVAVCLLSLRWAILNFADSFALETLQDLYVRVEALSGGWEGGSATGVVFEVTGISSLLRFIPYGAFTALFRPLPGEVMNPFGLLAGLENLVLLMLVGMAIARMTRDRLRDVIVQWAIAFTLAWSFVYAFASSQNLGAAVRFKLQILPVMLGLLLYLSRRSHGTSGDRLSANGQPQT